MLFELLVGLCTLCWNNQFFFLNSFSNGDLEVAAVFDIGGVFFFLMTLVLILVWPYLFCYYADSATDRISNIQRSVYNLNWYSFPPEQQKHLILIMAQSQRTVCFTGLNLIRCKLISFGMVIIKFSLSICAYVLINILLSFWLGLTACQIINFILPGF